MGLFKKLFKIAPSKKDQRFEQVQLLQGSGRDFTPYAGELWDNDLVRAVVNKIASYASLIIFEHVRGVGESFQKVDDTLNRLLTVRPNEYMSPADLQYKVWVSLLLTNNAYIWIQWDGRTGQPKRLLPIIANQSELVEKSDFLFYRFTFRDGSKTVVPAEDIIHFRREYYANDYFGSANDPLRNSLGLLDSMQKATDAAMKNSATLRGIMKHINTVAPEDLKKHKELFKETLSPENNGGFGVIDAKFDYIPVNFSGKVLDAEQMAEIRNNVYRYFGLNDKIMLSSYTSEEWQSYHEAVIAPILNEMEQTYTRCLFSDKELGYGNRVVSSVNQITFMNANQRISMVKLALDGALYTRNEIRAWFGDAPIPGGDTFQYSKNFTEQNAPNGTTDEGGVESGEETTASDITGNLPSGTETS